MKVRKAIIPAAGLGTRMLPATKTVPKEMLPIVDKPGIQYIVEEAAASGIEQILLITNRAKTAMDDYFDYFPELEDRLLRDGKTAEARLVRQTAELADVFYVRQKETKGLGHAVACAKNFVGDEPFAVLLGDDIMVSEKPVLRQLLEVAESYECSVVGAKEVSDEAIGKYSSLLVQPAGGSVFQVTDMIEKPKPGEKFSNYAILGRYVLTPEIFEILEHTAPGRGGEIQLTDGLKTLCAHQRVMAVNFEGRRYDTGNLCGYLQANMDFALVHPETAGWMRDYILQKAAELVEK